MLAEKLAKRESGRHRRDRHSEKISILNNIRMVLIVIIELNVVFFVNSNLLIRRNSEILYDNMLQADKNTLQDSVNNTVRDIESTRVLLENQGKTEEEVKGEIQERMHAKIHSDEYSGGRYMWVNEILDYSGGDDYAVRLIHPNPTSSEGMKLSTDMEDAAGNKPYQMELDLVNTSGSGFYSYFYQADENIKPVEKITYCMLYRDYNWVICEGENLSSIHEYETNQREALLPFLYRTDLIMSLVCMGITLITSWAFTSRYNRILVEKNNALNDLAYKDALTGLYNRGGLVRQTEDVMQKKGTEKLTGIFIDLDDFKLINDLYGHDFGDRALCHLADYLRCSFPDALIGRTGGDEFCVFIPNKSAEECQALFEKVIPGEKELAWHGKNIRYTISGGYADYPAQASGREELMTMMDTALYAAKIDGKRSVRRFQPDMTGLKREPLGFNVKNMAYGMPGAFLVYKRGGDEEILFANDHLITLFECENYTDFLRYTQSSFRHIVYREDLERVERSVEEQITREKNSADGTKGSYEDFVEYRIQTKTGKIRRVIDMGRLVHDQHYGEIFYVFIEDLDKLRNVSTLNL